jgi:hypothetical protein
VVAYRRGYSRVFAREYAWRSSGTLEEHTVRRAPTRPTRNFLWNGLVSGTRWKVGDPSIMDRRI